MNRIRNWLKRYLPWLVIVLCLIPTLTLAKTAQLEWEHSPTSTVVGYKIHKSTQSVFSNQEIVTVGYITNYNWENLQDDVGFWFAVSAIDGEGNESVLSNVVFSPPVLELDIQWQIIP